MFDRVMRRLVHSPFAPHLRRAPLIVHGCHHKAGTVWFMRVLRAVSQRWSLPMLMGEQAELGREAIFMQSHSRIDPAALPRRRRGTHMIRDPRDMIVSGYHYHKRTTEEWALQPRDRFGGKSYQAHLNGLDAHEGLAEEIRRFAERGQGRIMAAWTYAEPGFLEVRYEDMMQDEAGGWARIFDHYGFNARSRDEAVEIAMGFSLSKVKGKLDHVRSGRPEEWREQFSAEHRALFRELTGDLAAKLGYAPTLDGPPAEAPAPAPAPAPASGKGSAA
ncbi:MAG: sulfotransferase domain-containing protein [Pseudomonadota bacterium]